MAMTLVKKTRDYSIFLRGDQRYAIQAPGRKPINGDDKVRILAAEGLVDVAPPAAQAPATTGPEEMAEQADADADAPQDADGDTPQETAVADAPGEDVEDSGGEDKGG